MFNGFIASAIDGMKSVGRKADKNLIIGLALRGSVYANSIIGQERFICTENNEISKLVCGDDDTIKSGKS